MKIDFNNPIIYGDYCDIYKKVDKLPDLNNKSILITGATGMIPSYLVGFFSFLVEEKGFDIDIFIAIRNKKKANDMFGTPPYLHYVDYDAKEPFLFSSPLDYIIHAASLASPQYYGSNPVETILPNTLGTDSLLKYCLKFKPLKFLFFSSDGIYGKIDESKKPDEKNLGCFNYTETGNFYGESKRCGEMFCLAYLKQYDIPINIARISHTYGPTMDYNNDHRVFSEFVKNAINKEDIVLKSDGLSSRSFCYITDLLIQLITILIKAENGDIFNVGNPYQHLTIKQLAEIISQLVQPNLAVSIQQRTESNYCSSSVVKIKRDISKIEKLVGFKPSIDANTGFDRTIKAITYDILNN